MANATANITSQGFTGKNSDPTGFVFGPDTRGTIDIVYGCIVVLITALWTVIHINIPAVGDSLWCVLLRRLRWGCVSIFAPDFLTLVAAAQWDSASKSVAQMRALLQLKGEPEEEKWCLEHAFYANSGGFLLQSPDSQTFPVNAASIHYLVSKDYIALPDITVDEIWDKSKADVFAKGAAILQGVWLIVQSVARFAQGLPLSPLELFTLAFVVSTAASYFFWWRKPQNVSTHTVLVCSSSVATIRAEAGLSEGEWERTPMDFVEREGQTWTRRERFSRFDLEANPQTELRRPSKTSTDDDTSDSDDDVKVKMNELNLGETKCSEPDTPLTSPQLSPTCTLRSPSQAGSEDPEFKLRRKDSTITLVGEPISPKSPSTSARSTICPLKQGLDMPVLSKPSSITSLANIEVSSRQQEPPPPPVQRIPDDAFMPARLSINVLGSVIIPSMIHSSIHLLGWNLHYPSDIEKQLWRVSAVILIAMMCISVGTVRLLAITGYKGRYHLVWVWVNTSWEPKAKKKSQLNNKNSQKEDLAKGSTALMAMGEWFGDVSFWEVFLAFGTAMLVVARGYIIVEVIISFRALPQDVFVTVNWLNFIPHV